jgi:hypothetical protein
LHKNIGCAEKGTGKKRDRWPDVTKKYTLQKRFVLAVCMDSGEKRRFY